MKSKSKQRMAISVDSELHMRLKKICVLSVGYTPMNGVVNLLIHKFVDAVERHAGNEGSADEWLSLLKPLEDEQ